MKTVAREEILDFVTYEERRASLRQAAMKAKDLRRVHVGRHLTFLFENHETIRYQVQEMTRAERMVKEADIRHELETYNELLGQDGALGCTLLIEIDDPEQRAVKLACWLSLPQRLYAELPDGRRVRACCDPRQIGERRLSSVQYLKFPVGGQPPVAIGCDLDDPDVRAHAPLTPEQRAALAEDLASE
jgi:hypothetical protein